MELRWPRAGDHLRVNRGPYSHHGVAVRAIAPPTAVVRNIKRQFVRRAEREEFETLVDLWRAGLVVDVVHYVKGSAGKGQLQRTSFKAFLAGSDEATILLPSAGVLPPEEAEHRALSFVGLGDYSLIEHNCEHFSTWCSTGYWASTQVDSGIRVLAQATAALGVSILSPIALLQFAVLLEMPGPDRPMEPCRICAHPHPWHLRTTGTGEELARVKARSRQAEADSAVHAPDRLLMERVDKYVQDIAQSVWDPSDPTKPWWYTHAIQGLPLPPMQTT